MALKKTNVSFPFNGGLDEKISEKVAPPGTLETAENCQFNKNGEIVKRKGYESMWTATGNWDTNTPLDPNTIIAGGDNVEAHGDELLIADGKRLFSMFDGYAKDKGEYLNCTFHNKDVLQDEAEKNGPVQHVRFDTDAGDEYDLFVFTTTKPVGNTAIVPPTVTANYAIASVDTGEIILGPVPFVSLVRANLSDPDDEASNPLPQVLYNPSLKSAYIFYANRTTQGGTTELRYFYQALRLDTVQNFGTISSAVSITDLSDASGAPCPPPVQLFCCMVVDQEVAVTSTSGVYLSFYGQQSKGDDAPGNLILLHLVYAGSISSPSLTLKTVKDVTGGVYTSSAFESQDLEIQTRFGTNVRLSLKCTPNTSRPVSLFYSVRDGSTSIDYRTKCSSFDPSLTSQTDIVFPGFRVLLNATTFAHSTNTTNNDIIINTVEDRGHGGNFTSAGKGGITATTVGTGFTEGVYSMPSTAAYGTNPAKIYIPVNGVGTPQVGQITVLDGGNNLASGANYLIQSPTSGTDAVYQFNATETPSKLRQAESQMLFYDNKDMSVASTNPTPNRVLKRAYLLSDLFYFEFNNSQIETASKRPYCLISNPSGPGQTSSGTTALINMNHDVVAFGLPGEMPLSNGTEINSLITNKFSLLQPTQRVQQKNNKILIGSSRFVRDNRTTTTSTTSLSTLAGSDVFEDQTYNGTLITIDAAPGRACPMLSLKDKMLLGGGGLFSYDSESIVESDFLHGPEFLNVKVVDLTNGTRTSQDLDAGDYSYAAVYSAIDNKGNLHESTVIFSDSVQISGTNKCVFIELPICSVTRRGQYRLDLYRTDADGQIYYKISGNVVNNLGISTSTNSTKQFIDGSNLEGEEVLYTTGGIAQNFNPGSVTDLKLHKDKVIASMPNGFIAVSKPALVGESMSFPLVGPFVLNLGNVVKEITAIGSARDMLIAFTEDEVYAYMGDGPTATGAVGFTQPKLLSTGQGAIPGSPVVSSSAGMYYFTERGLYSVLSNGQIQYISPQVESVLDLPNVVGMDLFDEVNELRIALSTGKILIYNYLFKRWSMWVTNINNLTSQTRYQPSSGVSENAHVLVNSFGTPTRQSLNGYQDSKVNFTYNPISGVYARITSTASYDLKIKTTPISANQLFGAQRVYRVMLLGDYLSSHRASYAVYNDYSSSASTNGNLTVSSDTDPYLYRLHLIKQKSRAVQLEFTADNSTGASLVLSGIAFEIGGRPDTFKLPETQTIAGS